MRSSAQLTGNFVTSLAIIDILIKASAPGDWGLSENLHFHLGKHVSSLMFAK